ncbi:MAG TPA: hypothetical protein VHM31_03250, partial [Polyangia bacterium]|nr:hypothetical protein [Polyangia bacterium]
MPTIVFNARGMFARRSRLGGAARDGFRTRAVVLIAGALALAGACTYDSHPLAGGLTCGTGSRQCPDGYTCYAGGLGAGCDNTCWPNGMALPTASTVCPVETSGTDAAVTGTGGAAGHAGGAAGH